MMISNENPNVAREMSKYDCHKQVWALKIKDIAMELLEDFVGEGKMEANGAIITPFEEAYAPFKVEQEYLDKFKPEIGGYYVVYKDGYKSYSPAGAFEDGYTLIK